MTLEVLLKIKKMNIYSITGTFHGSIVNANSEGEARKIFHKYYNGESIICLIKRKIRYY